VSNLENLATMSLPLTGQFGIDFTFSREGEFLAIRSFEGHTVSVWQLRTQRLIAEIEIDPAHSVCFGAKENCMISTSHDNSARVWELPTGDAALWTRGLGATASVEFSPRGQWLAWTGKEVAPDKKTQVNRFNLAVLRAADGMNVLSAVTEGVIDAIAFDPDEEWIAMRSGDTVRVFNLRTREESPEMAGATEAWFTVTPPPEKKLPDALQERDTVQSLWSPRGSWLVTRHPGRVRVWDAATETELTEFPVPSDITGVIISPNDRYLAIGQGDGDLQIRTLSDGIEIALLPHDGAVTHFAFSPDGRFIASCGVDAHLIKMWMVSSELLMDDVRRRLDRDLTREEWALFAGNEPYSETRLAVSARVRRGSRAQSAAGSL
jgi:WD40 repeat protein